MAVCRVRAQRAQFPWRVKWPISWGWLSVPRSPGMRNFLPFETRFSFECKAAKRQRGRNTSLFTGKSICRLICQQLFDDPQINWDGKNLGCCRNFWGDFGGNAFADGLRACFNHEKMNYARAMLRGRAPPRNGPACTTCEMYHSMRARSDWVGRDGLTNDKSAENPG